MATDDKRQDPPEGRRSDGRRKTAIVLGAGVAGLTAAHELAIRGFDVHVVEREMDRRAAGDQPALGGLARSQVIWVRPPRARKGGKRDENGELDVVPSSLLSVWNVGTSTRTDAGGDDADASDGSALFPVRTMEPQFAVPVARICVTWSAGEPRKSGPWGDEEPNVEMHSTGQEISAALAKDPWNHGAPRFEQLQIRLRTTEERAETMSNAQKADLASKVLIEFDRKIELEANNRALQAVRNWMSGDPAIVVVTERADLHYPDNRAINSDILWLQPEVPPRRGRRRSAIYECVGEHGYRFFPSFYHHVFDTMRRTPILPDTTDDWSFDPEATDRSLDGDTSYRTVFDNLVSQDIFAIGLPGDGEGLSFVDRSGSSGLSGIRDLAKLFQGRLGFQSRDITRFQLRLLAYLTSCRSRRVSMERRTWADYVRLDDGYGDAFREAMNTWPQVLVGMKATETDARTYAAVAAQVMTDTGKGAESLRDATLNGPTTTAWFDPWRRYLRRMLGVRFHRDEALWLYHHQGGNVDSGEQKQSRHVRVRFTDGLEYEDCTPASHGENGGLSDGVSTFKGPPKTDRPADLTRLGVHWHESGSEQNPPSVPTDRAIGGVQSQAREDDVTASAPRRDAPARRPRRPSSTDCVLPRDAYLVLAVNPVEAHRLIKTLEVQDPEVGRKSSWVSDTVNVLGESFHPSSLRVGDMVKDDPSSPLRHFVGIQYFFPERDLPYLRGHIFLPQHPYGLSAISQAQFYRHRASSRATRGTLSFDLGNVATAGTDAQGSAVDSAWSRSRKEMATEVWDHLHACLDDESLDSVGGESLPVLYNVDQGLVYTAPECDVQPVWWEPYSNSCVPDDDAWLLCPWRLEPDWRSQGGVVDDNSGPVQFNNTPYLIVPPGKYRTWPGRLDADRPTLGYEVELGNLVCCGTHTKTFTRMATMESANESARHAVNGILRHQFQGRPPEASKGLSPRTGEAQHGYCAIHPLEDRDGAGLEFAKRIDQALHDEGLPHLFDVLKLDELVRDGHRGDGDTGTSVYDEMLDLLTNPWPDPTRLARYASPFLLKMLATFLRAAR